MTRRRMRAKRGDVVLVLFPHADLQTAKVRPALIVQADRLQTGLPQLIVAMISSNMGRSGHPSRRSIDLTSTEGQGSGLLTASVVLTDNLATVAEAAIYRIIGKLPMADIDQALKHTLGL